jgi:WhiB family redox-sensing transcriptional regulator
MTAVDERVCAPRITSGREADEPYSSWVRRAKCAGRAALFGDEQRADEALAVCGRCPVRRQCRRWALTNAVDGVAGGMTAAERAGWRREAGQPEPIVTVEDFLLAEVVSADTTWGRGRSEAS